MEKEQVISLDEFRTKLSRKEPFDGYVKDIGRAYTMFSLHGMVQYLDCTVELKKTRRKIEDEFENKFKSEIAPQDATRIDLKERSANFKDRLIAIEMQKTANIIDHHVDKLKKEMEWNNKMEESINKINKMREAANASNKQTPQNNAMSPDSIYPGNKYSQAYMHNSSSDSIPPQYSNHSKYTTSYEDFIIGYTDVPSNFNRVTGVTSAINNVYGYNVENARYSESMKLRSQQKNLASLTEKANFSKALNKGTFVISLVLIGVDVYSNGELKVSHLVDLALGVGFYLIASNPFGMAVVAVYIAVDLMTYFGTGKSLTQHIVEDLGFERTLWQSEERRRSDFYQHQINKAPDYK